MIEAVNALIECIVTGLFTAVFLLIAARIGWLPITLMMSLEDLEEEEVDEQ